MNEQDSKPSYIGGVIGEAFLMQAMFTQLSRKRKGESTDNLESRIRAKIQNKGK